MKRKLSAGFATRDITPPVGADIPGGFAPRPSTGVLDPLHTTISVLDDGTTRLCLIGVDAVSLNGATADTIRERVGARLKIPIAAVTIAASHDHCAGPTNDVLGTDADPLYLSFLADQIEAGAIEADERRRPARCVSGTGSCAGHIFNRRFKMRDGSEVSMPAHDNPDVVGPAGPIDTDLGVIGFQGTDGTWLGVIASIGCHPTVIWGDRFSADYPGAWRCALRDRLGGDATLVFLNGACGNVATRNHAAPPPTESSPAQAAALGAALADETIRLLRERPADPDPQLALLHGGVRVDYRRPDAAMLEAARTLLATPGHAWDREAWIARDRLLLAEDLGDARDVFCPITVYHIGAAAIVAIPWQPFAEFSLRIKQAAPHWQPLILATFANGSLGYVPTPEGFVGGGYEPTLCRGSKLVPEAGGLICDETVRLLCAQTGDAPTR